MRCAIAGGGIGGLATALSGLPLAVLASNAITDRTSPAQWERASRVGLVVYLVLIFVLLKLS